LRPAAIDAMTKAAGQLVKNHSVCSRSTALEGVGPIGAMSLHATIGSGAAFSKGREVSAYVGLTPRQYSSGGKASIVGLSKRVGNEQANGLTQGIIKASPRCQEAESPDLCRTIVVSESGDLC
jgi:transposase